MALSDYLRGRRWYGGKARIIRSISITEVIPLPHASAVICLALVYVRYRTGGTETYQLLLGFAGGAEADRLPGEPGAQLARLEPRDGMRAGMIFEALPAPAVDEALLRVIAGHRNLTGSHGVLIGAATGALGRLVEHAGGLLTPAMMGAEQSNSSIVYGRRLVLKIFRRLQPGIHPDLEVGRFLTERGFAHVPPVAGFLEYRPHRGVPTTVAILQGFVPNRGDAWRYAMDLLRDHFIRVGRLEPPAERPPASIAGLLDLAAAPPPALVRQALASSLDAATLLGRRTAELHLALSSGAGNPDFTPVLLSPSDRRRIARTIQRNAGRVFALAKGRQGLPDHVQPAVGQVLDRETAIMRRVWSIVEQPVNAMAIRCHGDYHLGQVLYTGTDFIIIDFEGEPARPLGERRRKHPALRDVAGMLRSFHYAAFAALDHHVVGDPDPRARRAAMEPWAHFWHVWASVAFLKAYLEHAGGGQVLPTTREEIAVLLNAYLLDKAVYELGYELNNRPAWATIPAHGIVELIPDEGD